MINKIEVGKFCTGGCVKINGDDILTETYDDITLNDVVYKQILILLNQVKNELDIFEWADLMKIIITRNNKYKMIVDNITDCDECGNWNEYQKYELKD